MSDTHADTGLSFVRGEMVDEQTAPLSEHGVIGWMRHNLFDGWFNTVLTLIAVWIIWTVVPPLLKFGLFDAVWSGTDRTACATTEQGGEIQAAGWFGACWPYIDAYVAQFIYGRYPLDERWRPTLVFILFAAGLIPMLMPSAPFKRENILYMAVIFPVAAFILLNGGNIHYEGFLGIGGAIAGPGFVAFLIDYIVLTALVCGIAAAWARVTAGSPVDSAKFAAIVMAAIGIVLLLLAMPFGLNHVETEVWGGLLVTLVIAVTGIAASLPLGIVLALGRRSNMPIVRFASVVFIEFWRGVPLITVLFMSSVMLPLFLPEGVTFDKLLRALIGVGLFSAAYMAEVVRGGLQAIHSGQYEGADAVGLTYWQKMQLIILPQALKLVIPGIVNTFIGLFKDTTLVLIIGLFDFLGQIQSSFTDPIWSSPVQSVTAYFFAAIIYWIFCFSMSRYSIFTEKRLYTGH
jgi:general L-amino acid transport system permease protein